MEELTPDFTGAEAAKVDENLYLTLGIGMGLSTALLTDMIVESMKEGVMDSISNLDGGVLKNFLQAS